MEELFLKFSTPEIDQATINEVIDCLKSGWLATGPRVAHFENNLRDFFQAPYALALNSATAGLSITLQAMGIGPGDEVITTPMTFVASLNAIVHSGAKPVLVDVDLATRNLDLSQAKEAITSKTKAILPVHFAGIPVDLDPLYQLAQQFNLRVIEDAAHAIGSSYKGKKIGSFGDTQVFSFHPNKVITTGEGGAVITRDEKLAQRIKVLRFHGIDREAWDRYAKRGDQYYDVIEPGYKYNMMDLQAAIGLHQLLRLEEFVLKRQELVANYQRSLLNIPGLQCPELPKYPCNISWYIYAPLITKEAKLSRDEFIKRMKGANIGTGYHHHAAHLYTFYQKRFGYRLGQFPNAEKISQEIVSLPLYASLTTLDQERVIETITRILQ